MPCVNWVILKVTQLCNLNCTYCYVYNRGDDSWSHRARFILPSVVERLAERVREHCATHNLDSFTVEFHGGEPLLLGLIRFREMLRTLALASTDECRLSFVLQTNGLLLTEKWLQLFEEYNVSFGVSLDGPIPDALDQRLSRKGLPKSKDATAHLLKLRQRFPSHEARFGGALCVINPVLNGAETTRWFWHQGVRSIDFLLPDGNASNLPANWDGPNGYEAFLIDAFDEWAIINDPDFRIRTFELMITALMGVRPRLDALGGDLTTLCVVETDGSLGILDTLRMCGAPFSSDAFSIFRHSFDEFRSSFEISRIAEPCNQCKECTAFAACGGGYLPHRFNGADFDQPSLYCSALFALVNHIRQFVARHFDEAIT